MTDKHPVSPPPELVVNWWNEAPGTKEQLATRVATRTAQWGADQELDAICHWLRTGPYGASIACHAEQMISDLRAARRPKPPSLKQQGLDALSLLCEGPNPTAFVKCKDTILRALEALPDD